MALPSSSFSFASYFAPYFVSLLLLHLVLLSNNSAAKHNGYVGHHGHHRHRAASNASNPRLYRAYLALQAWKHVIYSDPYNFTTNWSGLSVCGYTGVYCAPALDDNKTTVIAGIDLNFADLAGFLPEELGLLTDLALLHLSNNRFCGILPMALSNLTLLYELDLSNNRFVGPFPAVILSLPSIYYLDLRFNDFEGPVPPALFRKGMDAIFLNNNRFTNTISASLAGNSASVLVFANNKFGGCLPPSIADFADTLEELLLTNTSLSGCLPQEVGFLYKLRVLDTSSNNIVGPIPYSLAGLAHLEILNLGHNMMEGIVPAGVCTLPKLTNFTFSYNYFCEEEGICQNLTEKGISYDERENCLPEKPHQRSQKECKAVIEHPVYCSEHLCHRTGTGSFGSTVPFAPAPAPWPKPLPPASSPSPSPSGIS
ncbi:hypothetical protein MLD38_015817 [Melastoma candidum]|uniref:Uncharacterized protein n=1 Tax=Melastoma candidum TaxID=119954 RepID=A0ACB9RJA7_9MYRT|nr:hypothetical protein MLD38_015817 [Melastoma candidum]